MCVPNGVHVSFPRLFPINVTNIFVLSCHEGTWAYTHDVGAVSFAGSNIVIPASVSAQQVRRGKRK